MVTELLSNPKIVGGFSIGALTTFFGGFIIRNLFRGYCTHIPFSAGDWMVIPTKRAGIYDWFCTLIAGPLLLLFGLVCLGVFISELVKEL